MESLKGKKLLILAGASVHNKVVTTAKEMGIYTIVTDYLTDSPAKKLADEAWMYDIMDIDGIVKKCREVGVEGVINFCIDSGQLPYLKICKELNLPCIGTDETFSILTNKRSFKEYCIKHNVDVIPEYTYDEIMNDKVEYPIFIKPIDGRGSRGQKVCYNKEEAIKAIEYAKEISWTDGFLCEKYMGGKQDLATAYFVVDGEPYLVKFGDRLLGKKEDGLEKQVICTLLPSKFVDTYEKNVDERVKKMIKSLGIKFGPVFMQGFADGDTVRYYDPAQRMPGGDYDVVLEKVTGFSTVKSWINFAFTGDVKTCIGNPENSYRLNGGVAPLMSLSAKPGTITKISGMEEIAKNPNVIYARQIIEAGNVIPNSGDVQQRVVAFGAYFENRDELENFYKEVFDTYVMLDENGNNMIIRRFEH